jgi:transketolase
VSIEAGVTMGWHRWVGSKGIALGIDRYGTSAPGDIVMERLGMNPQAVIQAVQDLVP